MIERHICHQYSAVREGPSSPIYEGRLWREQMRGGKMGVDIRLGLYVEGILIPRPQIDTLENINFTSDRPVLAVCKSAQHLASGERVKRSLREIIGRKE
jgi:hypothetical protein